MKFPQRGFTLLELLVALSIFAIISVIAYGGLASVLESREQSLAAADRLKALQQLFSYLQRDIEQAAERPIRDSYGDSQPALLAASTTQRPLELTRGGYPNPLQLTRSSLQRVAYQLDDDQLSRHYWQVLDRAQDSNAVEALLIDGVERIELRLLDTEQQWHESWPPLNSGDQTTVQPLAIEITLELRDYGRITRLFRVGG